MRTHSPIKDYELIIKDTNPSNYFELPPSFIYTNYNKYVTLSITFGIIGTIIVCFFLLNIIESKFNIIINLLGILFGVVINFFSEKYKIIYLKVIRECNKLGNIYMDSFLNMLFNLGIYIIFTVNVGSFRMSVIFAIIGYLFFNLLSLKIERKT